jgi:hypothetical protein
VGATRWGPDATASKWGSIVRKLAENGAYKRYQPKCQAPRQALQAGRCSWAVPSGAEGSVRSTSANPEFDDGRLGGAIPVSLPDIARRRHVWIWPMPTSCRLQAVRHEPPAPNEQRRIDSFFLRQSITDSPKLVRPLRSDQSNERSKDYSSRRPHYRPPSSLPRRAATSQYRSQRKMRPNGHAYYAGHKLRLHIAWLT